MFFFNWLASKSIRTRIFMLVGMMIIPFCLLVQMYILPTIKDKILNGKKENTKSAVELALGTIDSYYQLFKDKKITEEEAKAQAMNAIKKMRYSGKEYFWINNLDLIMVMHPVNEKLVNQKLNEKKDPNGKYLFVEMVEVVKKDGEGYVNYEWPKPNETVPTPKISFVKGFTPWG